MVRRVTTNAAGSKAMQILLGRDFGTGSHGLSGPRQAGAGVGIDVHEKVCVCVCVCACAHSLFITLMGRSCLDALSSVAWLASVFLQARAPAASADAAAGNAPSTPGATRADRVRRSTATWAPDSNGMMANPLLAMKSAAAAPTASTLTSSREHKQGQGLFHRNTMDVSIGADSELSAGGDVFSPVGAATLSSTARRRLGMQSHPEPSAAVNPLLSVRRMSHAGRTVTMPMPAAHSSSLEGTVATGSSPVARSLRAAARMPVSPTLGSAPSESNSLSQSSNASLTVIASGANECPAPKQDSTPRSQPATPGPAIAQRRSSFRRLGSSDTIQGSQLWRDASSAGSTPTAADSPFLHSNPLAARHKKG